ncbi:hypothetical protein FJT64_006824 [Amphibalanus amphitrite]|uniref:Uncharacterized protein n=1 Tax=Amphibalanus amphitrite TaxID=1232801 RepID=A0A6A4W1J4_AMPAM|nr:hypothetical protein FJT64_006824 [Amphibalanus amphitrite]
MRERRRTGASSASYTGFKAVEGFQYPSIWKKAAQSVTTLILVTLGCQHGTNGGRQALYHLVAHEVFTNPDFARRVSELMQEC